MATQATSTLLNNAIATAQQLLTEYALGENLVNGLTTAFGASYDSDAATALIEQWQTGAFGSFPDVEIRSADQINGANGAFSADTNKIYISEEYLLANANNLEAVSSLVLEEFGHFVDSQINSVDSAGDEGAIFSGLVRGESFSDAELQQLQLENDQAVVNIDGQDIVIEQDTGTALLDKGATLLNHSNASLDQLAFGDFDGDGKTDVFKTGGGKWQVSYGGTTSFQTLQTNFRHVDQLAFGDFDGDGKTDVFRATGSKWIIESGGTTRQELNVNSASLDELEFGDFDGDGKTDVFRVDGNKWEVSYGGTSDWQLLNTSTAPLDQLAFGDFNGDGKTDVFRADGRRWHVSYGGTSDWQLLNGSGFGVDRLEFGDFNGDGKTDVFRPGYVSYGGTSGWQQVQPANFSLDSLAFGDFNGDNATDAFVAEGGAFYAFDSIGNQFGEGNITERTTVRELPGDFDLRSHLTNVYVGDFNGDGFDDFIRQEKGEWDDDNKNTANVFINNEDTTFTDKKLDDLGVNLKGDGSDKFFQKIGGTNLHIGDFNGDGKDDFLLQPKTEVNIDSSGVSETTAQIFTSNGGNNPFQDDQKFDINNGFGLRGDEINLYIGDFDGNGTDDILRQEKGELDNDNNGTARIFYTEKNDDGSISFKDEVDTLPENFHIKGDQTALFVGDFDGDGKDDFLRLGKPESGIANQLFFSNGDGTFRRKNLQNLSLSSNFDTIDVADINGDGKDDIFHFTYQEGTGSNRDETQYEYHLSHGDGTFGGGISGHRISGQSTLSQTHVELGDFNGDGNQDFFQLSGRGNDKNHITFLSSFESSASNQDPDTLVHGSAGKDTLRGRDHRNDTLIGGLGNDTLDGKGGNNSLLGGGGNDILDGGDGDDTLNGGEGIDFLLGGDGFDTAQYQGDLDRFDVSVNPNQTITVTDLKSRRDDNEGIDTLKNIEQLTFGDNSVVGIELGNASNDTLTGSAGIDLLFGGAGNDLLSGGEGDDSLDGGKGNDTLQGGKGVDVLKGGEGDDFLDGGTEGDVASFEGKREDFTIDFNPDGSITVTDDNVADGNEGTDTLTNISLLSFGDTTFSGNAQVSTVTAIAGTSENPNSISISGGAAEATNFVIDIDGETELTLDFNNQQLAAFINAITLPDQEIENKRLAANLAFDALGGGLGAIPVFGAAGATATALAQVIANYEFDLQQVEAQIKAADTAANSFNSREFGEINNNNREIVVIEDFKIGVDKIFLPSVAGGLQFDDGLLLDDGSFTDASSTDGNPDTNPNGVFIKAQGRPSESAFAFIRNSSGLSASAFSALIRDLVSTTASDGTVISTFNQTPIQVSPVREIADREGTHGGDHIIGLTAGKTLQAEGGGMFDLIGLYGDDFIQGNIQNDFLAGGFSDDTGEDGSPLIDGNLIYADDGFDTLQGGLGDDILDGGSGDDLLDGGGFKFDSGAEIEVDSLTGLPINPQEVLTNDGTDKLTGGSGNDTFVFNTLATGIDIITDFEVRIDKIRINADGFGATDISQFSFDQSNGALSFGSQQFATLENFASLQGFDVNEDIQLVFPNNPSPV